MLRSHPRTSPGSLPRSLATSATVHVLVLGAGIAWGVLVAGGEPRRARVWEATFLPSVELPDEPVEVLEPVEPPSEVTEAELRESELWAEQPSELAEDLVPVPSPGEPVPLDWFQPGPLAIGSIAAPTTEPEPEVVPVATVETPAPEPAPEPVVAEPVPLEKPAPDYPRLSRRRGEQGSVLCRLELDVAGAVTEVAVVESSGFARLDEAARETLATWRFAPRRVDGRAVPAHYLHRVTFQLDG